MLHSGALGEDSMLPSGEVGAKITKYQDFAEFKLKPQLAEFEKARDMLYRDLGQYLQLRNTIEMIQSQKLKQFETRVDLGCEFFATAVANQNQLQKFVVKVSKEYYVELNQEEALLYIAKKEKLMNTQIE